MEAATRPQLLLVVGVTGGVADCNNVLQSETNSEDDIVFTMLVTERGFTIGVDLQVIQDTCLDPADADGKDLVIISETVTSAVVGGAIDNANLPITYVEGRRKRERDRQRVRERERER